MHRGIEEWQGEHETTLKVIRALPEERRDDRPHEKSKSGAELCWHLAEAERWFLVEGMGLEGAGENLVPRDEPPGTVAAMAEALTRSHAALAEAAAAKEDAWWAEAVDFFGQALPREALLRMHIKHEVHHRGQLSVLLRLAGAPVPSIYGPSADEDWSPPEG